ncbi:DUF386 domain-containing protein [Oenococcus sp. UCMA 17063]|nr:DUF386 domain-containing protein [Oenococcus sp. UCMA 17063]
MTKINQLFHEWIIETVVNEKREQILKYFQSLDINNLKEGKYTISDESFFMIQNNKLKKIQENRFENHKQYCDFQFVLEGYERILFADVSKLEIQEDNYSKEDIAFFKQPNFLSNEVILGPGSGILFMPETAHKPCLLADDKSRYCRKLVLKVKK